MIDPPRGGAGGVFRKNVPDPKDETKRGTPSTASPLKFTRSVMNAIAPKYDAMGDFELVDERSKTGKVAVPKAIEEIRTAPVLHDHVCDKSEMKAAVKQFLGMA